MPANRLISPLQKEKRKRRGKREGAEDATLIYASLHFPYFLREKKGERGKRKRKREKEERG